MSASEPNPPDSDRAEDWTFQEGDEIAERYGILERLALGAFGEVHAARDAETDRRVALKILRTGSRQRDRKAVARMRQEAEILRALDHPNLVQVYDIGTAQGHEYLVMELLEGESLRDLIDGDDRPTPEQAGRIVRQILTALDAMHERGVQHRDIKPDNIILVGDDGNASAKLVDFGIAKARDFLDSEHEHTLVQTKDDEFVGTPRYAAPEQAVGDPVGSTADLFSLGLVTAEWFTGTPRINAGASRGVISVLIQPEPIDVSDCPEDWQPWLKKMLAKTPEDRPQSAREAIRLLPGDNAFEDPDETVPEQHEATEPLSRDIVADAGGELPEAAVGSPGDPLEPTEVRGGVPTVSERPGDGPPAGADAGDPTEPRDVSPRRPRRDSRPAPSRRAGRSPKDAPSTDPGTAPSEDSLGGSTLLWTLLALLFFVVSFGVFLYTLFTYF